MRQDHAGSPVPVRGGLRRQNVCRAPGRGGGDAASPRGGDEHGDARGSRAERGARKGGGVPGAVRQEGHARARRGSDALEVHDGRHSAARDAHRLVVAQVLGGDCRRSARARREHRYPARFAEPRCAPARGAFPGGTRGHNTVETGGHVRDASRGGVCGEQKAVPDAARAVKNQSAAVPGDDALRARDGSRRLRLGGAQEGARDPSETASRRDPGVRHRAEGGGAALREAATRAPAAGRREKSYARRRRGRRRRGGREKGTRGTRLGGARWPGRVRRRRRGRRRRGGPGGRGRRHREKNGRRRFRRFRHIERLRRRLRRERRGGGGRARRRGGDAGGCRRGGGGVGARARADDRRGGERGHEKRRRARRSRVFTRPASLRDAASAPAEARLRPAAAGRAVRDCGHQRRRDVAHHPRHAVRRGLRPREAACLRERLGRGRLRGRRRAERGREPVQRGVGEPGERGAEGGSRRAHRSGALLPSFFLGALRERARAARAAGHLAGPGGRRRASDARHGHRQDRTVPVPHASRTGRVETRAAHARHLGRAAPERR